MLEEQPDLPSGALIKFPSERFAVGKARFQPRQTKTPIQPPVGVKDIVKQVVLPPNRRPYNPATRKTIRPVDETEAISTFATAGEENINGTQTIPIKNSVNSSITVAAAQQSSQTSSL